MSTVVSATDQPRGRAGLAPRLTPIQSATAAIHDALTSSGLEVDGFGEGWLFVRQGDRTFLLEIKPEPPVGRYPGLKVTLPDDPIPSDQWPALRVVGDGCGDDPQVARLARDFRVRDELDPND